MVLRVNPTSFGQVVREERDRRNLTQKEVADQLAVSQRTVQGWEIADVVPRAKHRRAIIAWLEQEVAA